MFRRNKPDDSEPRMPFSLEGETENDEIGAPPMKPFSKKGSHMPTSKPAAAPFRPDMPRRMPDIPGAQRRPQGVSDPADDKKLIVGRDICLTGEISSCDRLIVEGTVEASLTNARSIDIADSGLFKGNAEIDEATINGRFEGKLVVHGRLAVRGQGRLSGEIAYESLVVEPGGLIEGRIEVLQPRALACEPPLLGPLGPAAQP
jgi:cytoskeletal protein CcmA (bactofilin family)